MRHFLGAGVAAGPIPRLPRGVPKPPRATVLIAAAGLPQRRAAGLLGARARAVPIPTVTVTAEEEHLAAILAPTDDKPKGIHAPPRAAQRGGQSRGGMRKRTPLNRAPVIRPEGPGCPDSGPSLFRRRRWEAIYRSLVTLATRPDCPPRLVRNSALSGAARHSKVPSLGRRVAVNGFGSSPTIQMACWMGMPGGEHHQCQLGRQHARAVRRQNPIRWPSG